MTSTPNSHRERQLDRSLLDVLLQLSPDAAIAVDDRGHIHAANELAADLFGYPLADLVDLGIDDLLPERFRAAHVRHRMRFGQLPRRRRMSAGLDLCGRRRDGTEFPVDVSLAPVTGPTGTIVVAAIRDMTERRQEQAAQAQLAAIVDSTDDAIVATTVDGTITSWNPGAIRLLGYEPNEIIGHHVDDLVPDHLRAELAATRNRVMAGEHVPPVETLRRRRDSVDVDVEVTLSAVRDTSGRVTGTAGIFRDITDRIRARAERAIAEQQRKELATLADRERIARDLHDLVIQRVFATGMAVQATTHMLSDNPDVVARLANIVDELDATIADIRSTIFDLEHHRAPADSVRAHVIDLVDDMSPALGHDPVVHFDGPVDTTVSGDVAEHALAVVREALSNIARHASATATRVEVVVGDALTIRVVDNGIGVGTPARSSGLRNMERRAEQLGGDWDIHSPQGGGTELVWSVPLPTI
jgi:PAS domain S-box-containing protein